jgi:hypothetical protein
MEFTDGTLLLGTLVVPELWPTRAVGPYKYFYRGDSTLRREFLSNLAGVEGVGGAQQSLLNARASGGFTDALELHGLDSAESAFIGVTDDIRVAEYFAKGSSQTAAGYVTTFRMHQSEWDALVANDMIVPNFENPYAFFEVNPVIGLAEREFLFPGQIDSRYIYRQTQMGN